MALLSKGTTLKLDNTLIQGLKSTGEISESVEKIEVTTLADSATKYISGIKSYGDAISFSCMYDKTEYMKVRDMQDDAEHTAVVTYPDGLTVTFKAYVSTTLGGAEVNSALEYTIELTPASEITFGNGASA